jgi:hypothetical protein
MYDPLSFMSHLATGTCKAHTPATMNPQTNADVVSTFQTAVYTIGLREPGTVPGFQVWGQKFVLSGVFRGGGGRWCDRPPPLAWSMQEAVRDRPPPPLV